MKRIITILLLYVLSANLFAQVNEIRMFSSMEGSLKLESGSKILAWGYGLDSAITPADPKAISVPGPFLELTEGDSIAIRFTNIGGEAHTIHLHGLDVSQVNDGVPSTSFYVWQGDTVYYSFNADYSGAYLYHCHVTTTMHLTMGMYGMIVVNREDSTLFQGGPKYSKTYNYLTSDIDTNFNPVSPPPLNEVVPNYFMINGKRGSMLLDDTINIDSTQQVAFRVSSMAYANTRYIFPENVKAEVFMSDGRPIPNSMVVDSFDVYPGERYSVILTGNFSDTTSILVKYFNSAHDEYKYTNELIVATSNIVVEDTVIDTLSIGNKIQRMNAIPNPFFNEVLIDNAPNGKYRLYDSRSNLISTFVNRKDQLKVDFLGRTNGVYFLLTPTGETLKLIKK